jgi:hypothetical protein
MKLTDIGEIRVIDFSEVVRWTVKNIRRNLPDRKIDEQQVEEVIANLVDRTLTIQMNWTKIKRYEPEEVYLGQMGATGHPENWLFVQDVIDEVQAFLRRFLTLPTWNIVSMRISGSFAEIELCEDFRIKDWMEKHAKEYGVHNSSKRW